MQGPTFKQQYKKGIQSRQFAEAERQTKQLINITGLTGYPGIKESTDYFVNIHEKDFVNAPHMEQTKNTW